MTEGRSKYSIQVLERAARLMELLAQSTEPLSLKDLVAQSDLNISTCHRILNDLVLAQFVEHLPGGRYQLGLRLLELGHLVKNRLNIQELAYPQMQELHRKTGETINLSIRQGDDIVYIERCWSGQSGIHVVRPIGGRAPLHLTAVGKLFLADFDAVELLDYVQRTGIPASTAKSVNEVQRLKNELAAIHQQGFAIDNEELEEGVRCLAAAILNEQGRVVAGFSLSAPAARIQYAWSQDLKRAAKDISRELGCFV
ncbi:IclR family transcriptional regulator [Oligella sp. HMSC09E12]|uniref:IclR family transcriptional regulator n=1 Tax=Oligella sp. HMSC09E12 TaxID=1581147 RepID=UPI0008A47A09|nr:IclR family transcriptional regulator [Oligella sp. HMSC09E12]OFV46513.1 IclR family transcriptional regulator [Oligella sp. HMSC09E12]